MAPMKNKEIREGHGLQEVIQQVGDEAWDEA